MPGISHSSYFFVFFLFLFHILKQWMDFSPEWPHHFTVTSATCQSSSFSASSLTHDVLSVLLVLAILIDVCRYIIMVLTCFSLMANDFEHLQGADWPCVSYKVCIQSCSFLILLFSYYWLEGSLYIFWMQVLSEICIVNIFSQSVFCLFYFLRCLLKRIFVEMYIYTRAHICIYIHIWYINVEWPDVAVGLKSLVQCPTLITLGKCAL